MKKVRIGGLIALLLMIAIIIYMKMMPVNTSFIGLVGEDWKSVTLYYYGDEMTLNDEEIQKVYDVFSDMEVECIGFINEKNYGDGLNKIYINGRRVTFYSNGIGFGVLKYQVSEILEYVKQLEELKKEFAAARGIALKN